MQCFWDDAGTSIVSLIFIMRYFHGEFSQILNQATKWLSLSCYPRLFPSFPISHCFSSLFPFGNACFVMKKEKKSKPSPWEPSCDLSHSVTFWITCPLIRLPHCFLFWKSDFNWHRLSMTSNIFTETELNKGGQGNKIVPNGLYIILWFRCFFSQTVKNSILDQVEEGDGRQEKILER